MEIICINDTFSLELLTLYTKYNVKMPKIDKIYTIRQIVNFIKGEKGVLLNEITNEPIPTINSMGFKAMMETAWAISRFTTLLGNVLTKEDLLEIKNEDKFVKIKIKENDIKI